MNTTTSANTYSRCGDPRLDPRLANTNSDSDSDSDFGCLFCGHFCSDYSCCPNCFGGYDDTDTDTDTDTETCPTKRTLPLTDTQCRKKPRSILKVDPNYVPPLPVSKEILDLLGSAPVYFRKLKYIDRIEKETGKKEIDNIYMNQ